MSHQYQLEVKENQVIKEDGFFFPASNFVITTSEGMINVDFKKGSKHRVVYQIISNNKVLDELTHPDYVPELSFGTYKDPQTLSTVEQVICAAFVKLGISHDDAYKTFAESKTWTYSVTQDTPAV